MNNEGISQTLLEKYNTPVPRYTSYPTVPNWKTLEGPDNWISVFKAKFSEQNSRDGISIYMHLPFCESLCTYCGCNKKITTNHSVENEYMLAIEKEWVMYRKMMKQTPVIREIHLGGGTPTFFSPSNLKKLVTAVLKGSIKHPKFEFSIEGHPNNTTKGHLAVLAGLGFKRISYGVQDNDPVVQKVINRIQPFENVKAATENARAAGFTSVNFDLIYGLPLQTVESIERTINQVVTLKPDRIAFYSYAHVPWTSRGQRLFDESDLPSPEEKIRIYMKGREVLVQNGYTEIGMDHFALPTDDLYVAFKEGRLHRSFMGYTTQKSGLLLGLGVSSISDTGNAFVQNHKTLHDYYAAVENGILPVQRGYFLSEQDIEFRKYISDISCKGETEFGNENRSLLEQYTFPKLIDLQKDGLIGWSGNTVKVTPRGHSFIRNICSAFDMYLNGGNVSMMFSKAI